MLLEIKKWNEMAKQFVLHLASSRCNINLNPYPAIFPSLENGK
jgi:hypothetical protein